MSYLHKFDVIGLTETWTNDPDLSDYFIDYEHVHKNADKIADHGRLSGGDRKSVV